MTVFGWDDIRGLLNDHDDLVERYCEVQSSATRILTGLHEKLEALTKQDIVTSARNVQSQPSPLEIRPKFSTDTAEGQKFQWKSDSFIAVARFLRKSWPNADISESPWPDFRLDLEFHDGTQLQVQVFGERQLIGQSIEMMIRFMNSEKQSVLTQRLLAIVTDEASFAHLAEYFGRLPPQGIPVAIAMLNSNATIKGWAYL